MHLALTVKTDGATMVSPVTALVISTRNTGNIFTMFTRSVSLTLMWLTTRLQGGTRLIEGFTLRQGGDVVKKKSEVQIFLERPERLDAIICNKLIEKQQWRDLALGITAQMGGERVQSSGSKSRMADAVEKLIDIESEIDDIVDELIAVKKNVVAVIEQLDSPMEYRVLHDRYIKFMSPQEIADKYNKDYTWATTTIGRAKKSLEAILDKERV